MTNAEKYLKDGIDEEEFIKELHLFWWANQYDVCDGIRKFLNAEAKKKTPTLTEDERVILRNVKWKGYSATHIGRARENKGSFIYLRFENDIEMTYFFDNFFRALIPIHKRTEKNIV